MLACPLPASRITFWWSWTYSCFLSFCSHRCSLALKRRISFVSHRCVPPARFSLPAMDESRAYPHLPNDARATLFRLHYLRGKFQTWAPIISGCLVVTYVERTLAYRPDQPSPVRAVPRPQVPPPQSQPLPPGYLTRPTLGVRQAKNSSGSSIVPAAYSEPPFSAESGAPPRSVNR